MKKRIKLTVGVTGLNNTDNPGPGVPVIRAIRESSDFDVRIIGFAYENLEPAIYMHGLVDKTYRIPYPSEGADILIKKIIEIAQTEGINVIIPNFDAELLAFMKWEKKLLEAGIATFLPTMKQFDERHKANLGTFGEKYGINVPSGASVVNLTELRTSIEKIGYPVVVKGKFYDAYIASNYEQAVHYYSKVVAKWGLPVILQEFITGTEVNVIALGDGKGNTVAAVPMRKLYITDKGKAWSGITLDDNSLVEMTRKLISATKWRGGMELELIKSDKGKLYLIEINPRIPAWVYLAVGAGQNIPEAVVKLALGEEVEPFTDFKKGLMFIRYSYDLITGIDEFENFSIKGVL